MNLGIEQLLSLLTEGFSHVEESMTIPLDREFLPPQQVKNLPPPIKSLYSSIFSKHKEPISLNNIMPFPIRKTEVPICNKVLPLAGRSIRCFDCSQHEASVFCVACFEKGNHEGHRFSKMQAGGGNCDCGNKSAIKPSGFCSDHCGEVEKMDISETQMKEFLFFFQYLFEWYFLLSANNQKTNSEKLSLLLLGHLQTLNAESVYYNELTKELFVKTINGKTILHKLFRVKNSKTVKVACNLYYKMFSLSQFRFILANEFIEAYNNVEGLEDTQYHHLFLQLFPNDDLVVELAEKGAILCPRGRRYKLVKILEDLLFITTIPEHACIKYFTKFFEMYRIIDLPFLDSIEEKIQIEGRHLVNVSSFITDENFFYFLFQSMMKIMKNQTAVLQKIIRELYRCLTSEKYKYARNCVVLPYHRALSMAIFTIFNGSIQNVTTKKLKQLFNASQNQIYAFFADTAKVFFRCLMQYAETFAKNSYFDNYSIIYVRSGCCCSRYDFLYIRMVSCLYQSKGLNFSKIILEVVKENSQKIQQSQKNMTHQEKIKQQISFIGLLVEVVISNRVEILLYKIFQLLNHELEKEYESLALSFFSFYKNLAFENLKDAQKHFLGKIDNQTFDKYLKFDKGKKKYSLVNDINKKEINSKYYVSLLKISELFPRGPLKSDYSTPLNQKNMRIFKAFDFKPLVETTLKDIITENKNLDENSSQILFNQLAEEVKKINFLRENAGIEKITLESKFQTVKEILVPSEQKKQNLKHKKEQKIRMMKLKGDQFLEKNRVVETKNSKNLQTEGKFCMMCKEKIEGSPVFCLAHIYEVNLLNWKKGNPKNTNVFISTCYHTVHLECFDIKQRKVCPLCKSSCNIFLPCPDVEYRKKDIQKLIDKFHSFATCNFPIQFQFQFRANRRKIFCHLVQSFPELIALCCMDFSPYYGEKEKKLTFSLIDFFTKIWELFEVQDKNSIIDYFSIQYPIYQKERKGNEQEAELITNLQNCIIQGVIGSLTSFNRMNKNQIYDKYREKLHESDLEIILGCLSRCLDGKYFSTQIPIKKIPSPKIPKLIDVIFNFYEPPKHIEELLVRETNKRMKCDSTHRTGKCVVCKQTFCYDCLQHQKHAEQMHASQMLFFSIFNGGIVYVQPTIESSKSMHLNSLYENRFGERWSTRLLPEGYYLDQNQYNKLLTLYISHGLLPYMMEVAEEGNGVGTTFIIEQTLQ